MSFVLTPRSSSKLEKHPCEDTSPTIKAGWLIKATRKRNLFSRSQVFHKRYFVLLQQQEGQEQHALTWYASLSQKKPNDSILLEETCQVRAVDDDNNQGENDKKEFDFELIVPSKQRRYLLRAATGEGRGEWIDALRQAIPVPVDVEQQKRDAIGDAEPEKQEQGDVQEQEGLEGQEEGVDVHEELEQALEHEGQEREEALDVQEHEPGSGDEKKEEGEEEEADVEVKRESKEVATASTGEAFAAMASGKEKEKEEGGLKAHGKKQDLSRPTSPTVRSKPPVVALSLSPPRSPALSSSASAAVKQEKGHEKGSSGAIPVGHVSITLPKSPGGSADGTAASPGPTPKTETLDEQHQQQQSQLARALAIISDMKDEIDDSRRSIVTHGEEARALQLQISCLEEQLSAARFDLTKLGFEKKAADTKYGKTTAALEQELRQVRHELQTQSETKNSLVEKLQLMHEEGEKLRALLTLSADADLVEGLRERLLAADTKEALLEGEVQSLASACMQHTTRVQSMERDLAATMQGHDTDTGRLRSTLAALEKDKERKKGEIAELQAALAAKTTVLFTFEKEKEVKEAEIAELQEALATKTHQLHIARREAEELRATTDGLQAQLVMARGYERQARRERPGEVEEEEALLSTGTLFVTVGDGDITDAADGKAEAEGLTDLVGQITSLLAQLETQANNALEEGDNGEAGAMTSFSAATTAVSPFGQLQTSDEDDGVELKEGNLQEQSPCRQQTMVQSLASGAIEMAEVLATRSKEFEAALAKMRREKNFYAAKAHYAGHQAMKLREMTQVVSAKATAFVAHADAVILSSAGEQRISPIREEEGEEEEGGDLSVDQGMIGALKMTKAELEAALQQQYEAHQVLEGELYTTADYEKAQEQDLQHPAIFGPSFEPASPGPVGSHRNKGDVSQAKVQELERKLQQAQACVKGLLANDDNTSSSSSHGDSTGAQGQLRGDPAVLWNQLVAVLGATADPAEARSTNRQELSPSGQGQQSSALAPTTSVSHTRDGSATLPLQNPEALKKEEARLNLQRQKLSEERKRMENLTAELSAQKRGIDEQMSFLAEQVATSRRYLEQRKAELMSGCASLSSSQSSHYKATAVPATRMATSPPPISSASSIASSSSSDSCPSPPLPPPSSSLTLLKKKVATTTAKQPHDDDHYEKEAARRYKMYATKPETLRAPKPPSSYSTKHTLRQHALQEKQRASPERPKTPGMVTSTRACSSSSCSPKTLKQIDELPLSQQRQQQQRQESHRTMASTVTTEKSADLTSRRRKSAATAAASPTASMRGKAAAMGATRAGLYATGASSSMATSSTLSSATSSPQVIKTEDMIRLKKEMDHLQRSFTEKSSAFESHRHSSRNGKKVNQKNDWK